MSGRLASAIALLVGLPVRAGVDAPEPLDRQIVLARAYVEAQAPALGLTEEDVREMRLSDAYTSGPTGVTHLYFVQRYAGIDVAGAMIDVHVTADGTVSGLGNRFLSDLSGRIASSTPAVSAESAITAVARFFGEPWTGPLEAVAADAGASSRAVSAGGGTGPEPTLAELVYHPVAGELRLAWNLLVHRSGSGGWWSVRVDAANGQILAAEERTAYLLDPLDPQPQAPPPVPDADTSGPLPGSPSGPSYRIFPPPAESPLHPAGVGTPQATVTDPAHVVASPFGWHDTNGAAGAEFTDTRGNNVDAYADALNTGTPSTPRPDGGPSLVFAFPFDQTIEPTSTTANINASVTELFAWTNHLHDVLYTYGFDEVAGNFQQNNYGRGGLGLDSVNAEGQDGSSICNANFLTPADGSRPRLQVSTCNGATPSRDGAMDHGVVVWAYANGVGDRLTGGPSTTACNINAETQRTGFADWLALMLTQTPAHVGATARGIGAYFFGQPADGPGIRPRPYSANLAVNEFTYDTIKTASIPHGVGHVWGTMLWDLTIALMGDAQFPGLPVGGNGAGGGSGFNPDLFTPWNSPAAGGNNLALQLVLEGQKHQPCNPGFVDARDAILTADEILTPGADHLPWTPDGRNACTLWTVFSRRGLGISASQGSSASRADGIQAFDMPESPVWDLSGRLVTGVEAFRGLSITASTVTVPGGAVLNLQSKTTVVFENGFAVEPGGRLEVVIDPDHC